ncbi:MAG: ABC transporter ATP-binding protein [Planctomycetes bacterium]|nr:ABC transporter ATP-binding protein [Planctomycetota bacterium]
MPEPASAEPVLRVVDFSKKYEGKPAVDHLTFDIAAGEILGLVGPNGAGKTTTLRTIAGILPIKEGNIRIFGFDIDRDEVEAKKYLAWVPDDPQPFDTLTVYEHLEFYAALHKVQNWQQRAEELLTRFELQEKRDALGGELSRGMRQKLSFCCAWLPKPKIVLLDEPLTGLDPRGIRSAKQSIVELASEGTAVILSSHLLDLVAELAHRILILNRGRRIFAGTIAEARATIAVRADATLEEIFMTATENAGDSAAGTSAAASPPPKIE